MIFVFLFLTYFTLYDSLSLYFLTSLIHLVLFSCHLSGSSSASHSHEPLSVSEITVSLYSASCYTSLLAWTVLFMIRTLLIISVLEIPRLYLQFRPLPIVAAILTTPQAQRQCKLKFDLLISRTYLLLSLFSLPLLKQLLTQLPNTKTWKSCLISRHPYSIDHTILLSIFLVDFTFSPFS